MIDARDTRTLRAQFDALLVQKEIPLRIRSDHRKWLRYCKILETSMDSKGQESQVFCPVQRLKEKGQTSQRHQVSHGISIGYGMATSHLNDPKVCEQIIRSYLTIKPELTFPAKTRLWSRRPENTGVTISMRPVRRKP